MTVLVGLAACGGKREEAAPAGSGAPAPSPGDAAVAPPDAAPDDWAACKDALAGAMKTPANRRVATILAACRPCGDWTPLLSWETPAAEGGPTRLAIEQAMLGCKAYCNANGKQRFLGTLDNARGTGSRAPWRFLGEQCKAEVSAVPDSRFMSAPYFALDRIARAAAARPELAPLLDAIELPLPVVSVTGSGFELASSPVTAPDAGPLALTVTAVEVRLAAVPLAKLTKDGVAVVANGEPYPGVLVKSAKELEAAAAKLGPPDAKLALFAPRGMSAIRVIDALAVAPKRDVRLAVTASGGPPGWSVAGTIPITLSTGRADPAAAKLVLGEDPDPVIAQAKADPAKLAKGIVIEIGPKTTLAGLAKLLGALVYFDATSVTIRKP